MKNIAPQLTRQRLLIEAYYSIKVNEDVIKDYFRNLLEQLELKAYGEPLIHFTKGEGKQENQGYDAFIPLIDSGIALYIWTNEKFLSCVLYTCKSFSAEDAITFTKEFFKTTEIESQSF